MKNSPRQFKPLNSQQASAWIDTLRNADPSDTAAFIAWLKESPDNVRDFLLMLSVDHALNDLVPSNEHDIAPLLADIERRAVAIPWPHMKPARKTPRYRSWRWGAMAAALMVLTIATWAMVVRNRPSWREFDTAVGEQRAFELEDGSIIDLNTHSRVTIRFRPGARDVRLLRGEVLFRVHHDAARPFRVYTEDAVVQAVGTQFDVYKRVNGTIVSVLQGRVNITAVTPSALDRSQASSIASTSTPNEGTADSNAKTRSIGMNEEAQISSAGFVNVREVKDISDAVAWRDRRLVFRQQTLEHIAAEFNRYNSRTIQLDGANIMSRVYSGVFDADDVDSFADVLARDRDLVVAKSDRGIIVKER
jgi:transmembrane sensor